MAPDEIRFWAKVEKSEECWNWTASLSRAGYGTFALGGRPRIASRVAYTFANGPIPEGLCVCHSCNNRKCVKPAHLWLGTKKDNSRDMAQKKRCGKWDNRGVNNPLARLTEENVKHILVKEHSQAEYAKLYKVDRSCISLVQRGVNWRHVT
jgi:hypothetical protein